MKAPNISRILVNELNARGVKREELAGMRGELVEDEARITVILVDGREVSIVITLASVAEEMLRVKAMH